MLPKPRSSRRVLLACAVAVNFTCGGLAWTYIIMLVPEVLADLSLELADWGLIWSAIAFGVLAFSIPAGVLGDRFGATRVVGGGLVLAGASLLLRASSPGFASMIASMALFGVGLAAIASNLPKALGAAFPQERLGMANGVSLTGLGAGQAVAALAAARASAELGGWRALTQGLGVLLLLTAVVWWLVLRRAHGVDAATPVSRVMPAIRRVIGVGQVWIVAVCYMLYLGGHLGAVGYLPTFFTTTRGFDPGLTGAIISLAPWCFIAGSVLLPWLSDTVGRRKVVYVAAIVAISGLVFAHGSLPVGPLAAASALWGICAGAAGILFVVPVEIARVGPRLAGTALGVIGSCGFAGGVLMPSVGLAIAERASVGALAFFAACFALSAALFATLPETGPRAQR